MPAKRPNLRHHERRTTHIERKDDAPQLDRRKHPLHTPMGEAQRTNELSDNYANLMYQAGRDQPSIEFMSLLKERYEKIRNRHLTRLVNFSERDELTGLLNKRGFKLRARYYIVNPEKVYSYVYIDMNNLKKINDQFGHGLGNIYLEVMGIAATELARRYEKSETKFTFARTGGDEFEMLISNPRTRGYDYDAITKKLIFEIQEIAKELWRSQKLQVVKDYSIDVPDLSFASGYSIAAKPCPVSVRDVKGYEKLGPEKIKQIDEHLDKMKLAAEKNRYKQKAEMKGGNGGSR